MSQLDLVIGSAGESWVSCIGMYICFLMFCFSQNGHIQFTRNADELNQRHARAADAPATHPSLRAPRRCWRCPESPVAPPPWGGGGTADPLSGANSRRSPATSFDGYDEVCLLTHCQARAARQLGGCASAALPKRIIEPDEFGRERQTHRLVHYVRCTACFSHRARTCPYGHGLAHCAEVAWSCRWCCM